MLLVNPRHIVKPSSRMVEPRAKRSRRQFPSYACSQSSSHNLADDSVKANSNDFFSLPNSSAHKFTALSRRIFGVAVAAFAVTSLATDAKGAMAGALEVDILEETKGFGSRGARRGDLLLFHYVGRLEATGQVFDSTRGGLTYRDGGDGVLRPAAITLGGGPVPGICEGLQQALAGMSIGGRRTVRVPPSLGFGSQTVLAPYGVVPSNSSLVYEVELLRLSAVGPDQLTKGISKCGVGGASQQAENCFRIAYEEFL